MTETSLRGVARFVVILVSVLLLLLIGSVLFAGQFVVTTINYVVGMLASRSGMSVVLVRSLVVLGTIPFFYAVAQFTRSAFGLLGIGINPLGPFKHRYSAMVVAYIGIFCGATYWASRDAYAYKYCADTPEGISLSDSAGKDKSYGVDFKPCTVQQIELLRNGSGQPAAPREIHIANASTYGWFDPVAGRPLVWYAQDADGHFRFFDHAGVDPTSGHPLQPITEDVVRQMVRQQASLRHGANAKHAVETGKAKEVAAEAADAAAKSADTFDAQELAKQAQGQFDSGDYKGAKETCERALSKAPGNADCVTIRQHASVKLAQQLVTQGQSQLEQGQLDEAMWSADEAMKLDPTNRNAAKLKLLALKLKPRASN